MAKFQTKIEDAVEPFVLGLDVGSTASRGGLYDARGLPIYGHKFKVPHTFTTGTDGKSTIDPDQVVDEICEILDRCAPKELAGKIGGVAIDTFSASLVGVGSDGHAVTPCYTYADSRSSAQVTKLRQEFDESEMQQRTGTRFHNSYLLPTLLWLREEHSALFSKVDRWMALGEYIYHRILGVTAIGTAGAAWTGLLDRRSGEWDRELLDYCGVRPEQMGEIRDPDQPLEPANDDIAQIWPALEGAKWFPVIADGLASNIGAGAPDEDSMALSAATSGAMRVVLHAIPDEIPPGLWCYRVDRNRSILGGAINDVGRAVSWADETFDLSVASAADHDVVSAISVVDPEQDQQTDYDHGDRIMRQDPNASTPLVLPFLTGERATGWAAGAKAMIVDVVAASDGPAMYRGVMEGVALTYVRVLDQLIEATGKRPEEIRASGRITQDLPNFQAVLADALNVPVLPIDIKRATLHGTALLALETIAPDVEREDVLLANRFEPREDNREHYDRAMKRFNEVYDALIDGA